MNKSHEAFMGDKRYQYPAYAPYSERKIPFNKMILLGLFFSCAGLLFWGLTGFMGVIFAHIGLSQIRVNPQKNEKLVAVIALILGYMQVALWIGVALIALL